MNKLYLFIAAVAGWLFLPHVLHADLLAGWDVEGVDVAELPAGVPYELAATTSTVSHVHAKLVLGSGVNPTTGTSQYGFKIGSGNEQVTLGGAITSEHYIEFSLMVDAGYRIDLSSLAMNGESSGTGADNVALLSDVDGFVAGRELASLGGRQGITGGWDTDSSGWGAPINLSGNADYRNLSSAIFRIYGWNTSGGVGVTALRNLAGNDLSVMGTVKAIPEPAVVSLIGLFGVGVLIMRRVKK